MIIVVSIDISLVGGFNPTPLKNHGVKVSWDDDIPNIWKNKINVPNHQPECHTPNKSHHTILIQPLVYPVFDLQIPAFVGRSSSTRGGSDPFWRVPKGLSSPVPGFVNAL